MNSVSSDHFKAKSGLGFGNYASGSHSSYYRHCCSYDKWQKMLLHAAVNKQSHSLAYPLYEPRVADGLKVEMLDW